MFYNIMIPTKEEFEAKLLETKNKMLAQQLDEFDDPREHIIEDMYGEDEFEDFIIDEEPY